MPKQYATVGPRVITPEMCDSRSLARCGIHANALWPRLIVQADDQGRLVGDALDIRGLCFPKMPGVGVRHVQTALDELEANGMILRYGDETPYIQLVKWWDHQSGMRRAYPSRYPAPIAWVDRVYGVPPRNAADVGTVPPNAAESGKVPPSRASAVPMPLPVPVPMPVTVTDPVVAYMKLTGSGRPAAVIEQKLRANAERYGHDEWLFAINQARDLYGSQNDIKNAETVAEERYVARQDEAKRRHHEEIAATKVTPEKAAENRAKVNAEIMRITKREAS